MVRTGAASGCSVALLALVFGCGGESRVGSTGASESGGRGAGTGATGGSGVTSGSGAAGGVAAVTCSSTGSGGEAGWLGSGERGEEPDPATCEHPPLDLTLSDWMDADRTAEKELVAVRKEIVGMWGGIATTPWTTPYEVMLEFYSDGHYGGQCLGNSNGDFLRPGCCAALYFGSDISCPVKRYSIDGVSPAGSVTGSIAIAFDYGAECCTPAWRGELSNVSVDAGLRRLRFDLSTSNGEGPVHFELTSLDIR